mgnify:CR=1 FL=1
MLTIKAYYNGLQEIPGFPSFELWTILQPLGIHCAYSTLSRATIESYGCIPEGVAPFGHKED